MTATQIQFRRGSAAQMATFTGAQGEVVVDTTNNRVVVQDGATAGGWPAARVAEVNQQCGRLSYVSATQIKFAPYNGGNVKIAGTLYQIPSAAITAANSSVYVNGTAAQNLAASTLYYVYLFNNSGTLTVDFCTTGHATDTTTGNVGVEIKSGDNSRTLVGMVRTNGSSQFEDDANGRLVASWFNRQAKSVNGNVSNQTTTSTTAVTLASGFCPFLAWADGEATIAINSVMYVSAAGQYGVMFATDDNGAGFQDTIQVSTTNTNPNYFAYNYQPIEGYRTLLFKALSSVGTNTFTLVNNAFVVTTRV
jgi:hypothetical protein